VAVGYKAPQAKVCVVGEKRTIWSKLQLTAVSRNCNLRGTVWLSLLEEHGDELLPTKLSICSASSIALSLLLKSSEEKTDFIVD